MTYTFKLARRLAVSRNFGMLPVLLLFAGCAGGDATSPENSPIDLPESGIYAWQPRESTPVVLLTSPSSVTIETNQLLQFRARGRNRAGDEVVAPVTWSTTGGTILPDGRFSAASVGSYQVTGSALTSAGTEMVQTSTITVVRRQAKLKSVVVTPSSTTLNPGVSQTFAAIGLLASGDTVPIGVTWSARGGTIDAGGLYVAGDTVGTFQVIAIKNAGTLADTAIITIAAPPSPPPPSDSTPPAPAPAPVLAQVTLVPASATLAPLTTKQFSAFGRTTTGDSVAVEVVFQATGGTVNSGGLFTAGSTAGTFRVIATSGVLADTSTITVTAPLGSGTATGIPFGPFDLWSTSYTAPAWGPAPFTASINADSPDGIITRVTAARGLGQKLILMMTSGSHTRYITDGAFDLAKWKARMDLYNTSAIKAAVAAGVADGTILGADVMDEPQHVSWGGVVTKPMLDDMALYVKAIFPTLPAGVSTRFSWRPTEFFKVIDFVTTQYIADYGSVTTWRDNALAAAKQNGVSVIFSINLLNGGAGFNETSCPIPPTGGWGLNAGRCAMGPQQVRDFGLALVPYGCAMVMWRYDNTFFANTENLQAFRDIAAKAAMLPQRACRRS
jgi:hypothetical protein